MSIEVQGYIDYESLKFKQEFQQLNSNKKQRIQSFPSWPVQSNNHSLFPDTTTSSKDRYSDVVPFEETRVKLQKRSEDESDYINASYISGEVPNSHHAYIACQAPLENTMDDYWRMIWEQVIDNLAIYNSISIDKYIFNIFYMLVYISIEGSSSHTLLIFISISIHDSRIAG